MDCSAKCHFNILKRAFHVALWSFINCTNYLDPEILLIYEHFKLFWWMLRSDATRRIPNFGYGTLYWAHIFPCELLLLLCGARGKEWSHGKRSWPESALLTWCSIKNTCFYKNYAFQCRVPSKLSFLHLYPCFTRGSILGVWRSIEFSIYFDHDILHIFSQFFLFWLILSFTQFSTQLTEYKTLGTMEAWISEAIFFWKWAYLLYCLSMAMAKRWRIDAVQQRTSLEVQISQRMGPKVHSRLI